MDIKKYFEFIEIESSYLNNLLLKTINKIIDSGFRQDLSFGAIIEGSTFSGEIGEVTEDNYIRINSNQLKKHEDDIAMAIIAHELAHSHLKHFESWENSLEKEYEADNLAREWGFDINRFHKICGPPTIQSHIVNLKLNSQKKPLTRR